MPDLFLIQLAIGENANEVALQHVSNTDATLIIIREVTFIPPVKVLLEYREQVYVIKTLHYLEAVRANIDAYKRFVIVNVKANNFEVEFFKQMCNKLDKTIICILPHC